MQKNIKNFFLASSAVAFLKFFLASFAVKFAMKVFHFQL